MAKKKSNKPKWRKEGNRMVTTLFADPLDALRMERGARRAAEIAAGTYGQRSGAGVHGGTTRAQNRRGRQNSKRQLNSGRFD